MTFTVGDTVVYPHHGAAKIEAVEKRVIKGEERDYLVLRVGMVFTLCVRCSGSRSRLERF